MSFVMGLNWVFVLLKSSSLPRGTSLLLLSMPLSLYFSERGFPGQGGRPIRFPFPCNLQISSFGVIPKKGQPGKWHLIVDLSSPGRFPSVNDGINPDEFTLHYLAVDQIICLVSCLGKGTLMAKFDVESAYHNVPVHPSDRFLLGMKWCDQYSVDLALPFKLRLAPFIYNAIPDMVE